MKIVVWPADGSGCGHYRLIWPALAAAAAGLDVSIEDVHVNVLRRWATSPDGRRPVREIEVPECDVIVTQRTLDIDMVEALEIMAGAGITVIVDIDDNFHAIDPNNVAYHSHHPSWSPRENFHHLARAAGAADLVTVTTPALARRYGGHGRCVVLPNYIPRSVLDVTVDRTGEPLTVGWTGRVATHPQDLQVTRGAVARAVAAVDASFAVVGPLESAGRLLHLDPATPVTDTGWVDFEDYHATVAATIDVGIVPLADTAFNEAKSALKVLEFAALGIPNISSPTPDNLRLAADGCTLIARRPRDWERLTRMLLTDSQWRAYVGERARAGAAAHTIEANAGKWVHAWTLADTAARQEVPA